jgi:hypothetical protein
VQLGEHLLDEGDVLAGAGSSGTFLCELSRHEIGCDPNETGYTEQHERYLKNDIA